jgi:hypothetical protein
MAKKWIAINLLLLVIAGLLGWELRAAILRFIDENDPAKIRPSRIVKPAAISLANSASKPSEKVPLPDDLTIISVKTIFSDTRGNEESIETARPPEPPPLAQKPILVGIIMQDNQYKVFIIDPTASADKRKPEAKRVGDVYRGYTITGISGDRIVLENGTRREIIPLHEAKKAQGGRTSTVPARVVAFGGSAVTGGAITVIGVRNAGGTRISTPTPVNVPSGGSQYPANIPGGVSTRTPVQPQTPTESTLPYTPQPPGSGPGSGTRIIRGPFGDMVRPDPNR